MRQVHPYYGGIVLGTLDLTHKKQRPPPPTHPTPPEWSPIQPMLVSVSVHYDNQWSFFLGTFVRAQPYQTNGKVSRTT